MSNSVVPPHPLILESLLKTWLLEDLGRGDRTTANLLASSYGFGKAQWLAKEAGVIAGLPIAAQVFTLLNPNVQFQQLIPEGENCPAGTVIATIQGPVDALLMGERVALNLAMRLSGIASLTQKYVAQIADCHAQLVDTRKTTPGLRILEKYALQVGGARNHRFGLDDAIMIKDNHQLAVGGISAAIAQLRPQIPYPLTIEVETSNLAEVQEALDQGANIIMLDNMDLETMTAAVNLIRQQNPQIAIEASGNITLNNLRQVAETGVDYISTSAPITRSSWLDLSMKFLLK